MSEPAPSYSPASPEGKILAVLCDLRVDQGFLTPERLGEVTRLHLKLVEDALATLEGAGCVAKDDNLLKKDVGRPARGYWWKPTAAGYAARFGTEALDSLRVKILVALESQTQHLPDAEAGNLRSVYVNFDLVNDVLRQLEEGGLTSSAPSLTFGNELRWQLTGKGARLVEDARTQTLEQSEASLGY